MQPSERFLTALRDVMDDRAMIDVALALQPVLNAADSGVYRFGRWDDEDDTLVSSDEDAIIDAVDVRSMMTRIAGKDIGDVLPVHLHDLNAPAFRRPWMRRDLDVGRLSSDIAQSMAIGLTESIAQPFWEIIDQRWSELQEAAERTGPALGAISEALGRSIAVRLTAAGPVRVTPALTVSLPALVLADLLGTLRLFLAAVILDASDLLYRVSPVVHLLDSCIPLGTKTGNEGTILLLVE